MASACTPPASSSESAVDHAVALEPGLPFERLRHDINAEMSLPARPVRRHGPRAGAIRHHLEALRARKPRSTFCDKIGGTHAAAAHIGGPATNLRVNGRHSLRFEDSRSYCQVLKASSQKRIMIGHEIRTRLCSTASASSRRRIAGRKPAARLANGRAARRRPPTARPKGRGNEKDYWRFCLDHVREYNQSYNFFAGMSDDAVMAYQKDALTGHRPTWKMGTGKGPARARISRSFGSGSDPFEPVRRGLARRAAGARGSGRPIRNAERKALDSSASRSAPRRIRSRCASRNW